MDRPSASPRSAEPATAKSREADHRTHTPAAPSKPRNRCPRRRQRWRHPQADNLGTRSTDAKHHGIRRSSHSPTPHVAECNTGRMRRRRSICQLHRLPAAARRAQRTTLIRPCTLGDRDLATTRLVWAAVDLTLFKCHDSLLRRELPPNLRPCPYVKVKTPRGPGARSAAQRTGCAKSTKLLLPGRTFASPADFNAQLTDWLPRANGRTVRGFGCPVDHLEGDLLR